MRITSPVGISSHGDVVVSAAHTHPTRIQTITFSPDDDLQHIQYSDPLMMIAGHNPEQPGHVGVAINVPVVFSSPYRGGNMVARVPNISPEFLRTIPTTGAGRADFEFAVYNMILLDLLAAVMLQQERQRAYQQRIRGN